MVRPADAVRLPTCRSFRQILDVVDGERFDDCVDVSVFTQHARCASADEATVQTDPIGQPADVNAIGVMMASGHSPISKAAARA